MLRTVHFGWSRGQEQSRKRPLRGHPPSAANPNNWALLEDLISRPFNVPLTGSNQSVHRYESICAHRVFPDVIRLCLALPCRSFLLALRPGVLTFPSVWHMSRDRSLAQSAAIDSTRDMTMPRVSSTFST
jgi:hypothetical protein